MKSLKWIAAFLASLVTLVAVIPLFISVDDYVPRIEQAASERLGEKVTIGRIRLALLPSPHATIGPVSVGSASDLSIPEIIVTPDVFSLLRDTKSIRSLEIRGMVLTQKAVDRIPAWSAPRSGEGPAVRMSRIELTEATLKLSAATIGPLDAMIEMNDGGTPTRLDARTRDGKLTIAVTPEKDRYAVHVAAKNWTPPVGPQLVFDDLTINGVATVTGAELSEVRARLYGGTVSGTATGAWQKGIEAKGEFDVRQVELERLVAVLSPGKHVSGRLTARPVVSARAADAGKLAEALRVESPFNVADGVLYGVDIARAASALLKEGSKGGETRFDTLAGHLVLDRGNYRFSNLRISSGSLSADGAVNISAKKELSGRINATVKAASIASATVPLNVSGTLQSPTVLPSSSYVAGAIAGTATLGPGLGTSVGSSLGRMAEGLFSSSKETKKKP